MLRYPVKYTDFDGNERNEIVLFNLTKSELTMMETSVNGGFKQMVEKIISEKNSTKIMETFEAIILKAYGEKSPDGKYFKKSKEISEAFKETMAYDTVFMELITDAKKASDFINGIMPTDLEINTISTI